MALVRSTRVPVAKPMTPPENLTKTTLDNLWLYDAQDTHRDLEEEESYTDSTFQENFITSITFIDATFDGNCTNALEHVEWTDVGMIGVFAVLILINLLVVCGNSLVILAVFSYSKLRSVTNLFIVSLAVADISLGIAVLPFSVIVEVFDTWIFGSVWCSVWLAVDVWMSTSSILNLVIISLDR